MIVPITKLGRYDIRDVILVQGITNPESPIHTCSYSSVKMLVEGDPEETQSYSTGGSITLDIPLKKYVPKENDKLFFHKGCTALREKVRSYAQKKKMSVTTKVENSNVEFISSSTFNSYISSCSGRGYPIRKDDFCEFIRLNYGDSLDYLCNAVKSCTNPFVMISFTNQTLMDIFLRNSNNSIRRLTDSCRHMGVKVTMNSINNTTSTSLYDNCNSIRYITDEDYNTLNYLISSPNVYRQDEIIKIVNEDSIVVDEAMYLQLESMMISGQESDAQMAIEIMANCNLDVSLGRIMFLLKYHYEKVSMFRCCTHVNFKSLLAYIGVKPSYLTVDSIIDILISKDLLSEEYFMDLLPIIKHDIQSHLRFGSGSAHFHVTKLACSEEIIKAISNKSQKNLEDSSTASR